MPSQRRCAGSPLVAAAAAVVMVVVLVMSVVVVAVPFTVGIQWGRRERLS